MNEQNTKADQEQTEAVKDLELTNEQAEEAKAGRTVKLENVLITGYQLGALDNN